MKDILLAVPPINEQRAILETLEAQLHSFRHSRERLEREIDLIREYRTRLIADVVTGKLDVREAAARLPDEPEAPDEAEALVESDEMPDDDSDFDPEAGADEA